MSNYRIIHLSHTGLDGLVSSYISYRFWSDVLFFNVDYGIEVSKTIREIANMVKEDNIDTILIITDINLNIVQCEILNKLIDDKFSVILFNHHPHGYQLAEKYNWFIIDDTKTSSRLYYEYLIESPFNKDIDNRPMLNILIDSVDNFELFLDKDSVEFKLAFVMNNLLNMISKFLSKSKRLFRLSSFSMFNSIDLDIFVSNIELAKAEDQFINAIRGYLSFVLFLNIKEYSLSGLLLLASVKELEDDNNIYLLNNMKCMMIDKNENIDLLASFILDRNSDIDFVMFTDYTKGSFSLRSRKGGIDVGDLAYRLFSGGGSQYSAGGRSNILITKIDRVQNTLEKIGFKKV